MHPILTHWDCLSRYTEAKMFAVRQKGFNENESEEESGYWRRVSKGCWVLAPAGKHKDRAIFRSRQKGIWGGRARTGEKRVSALLISISIQAVPKDIKRLAREKMFQVTKEGHPFLCDGCLVGQEGLTGAPSSTFAAWVGYRSLEGQRLSRHLGVGIYWSRQGEVAG